MKEVLGEKGTIKIVGADAFTQEGFTQIPNAILRSKEIGGMEKCTYSLLLSYAWHTWISRMRSPVASSLTASTSRY